MFGITTTLHGMAPLATYGLGALFYLVLAVTTFLAPAAMAAAELATGWPQEGGVYIWVSEAFGKPWGFLATWLQWLQNLIFWTVILTGSAAMLAIGFGYAEAANNRLFVVAFVVGTIWFTTLMTVRGLHSTAKLGIVGSLLGTLLPGVVLIALAVGYLISGGQNHLSLELSTLLPNLSQPGNLSFAISIILIFSGVELMGTRACEVSDLDKTYPRASLLAIGLTIALIAPVTLAISVLVPVQELNIAAGFIQAVAIVFSNNPGLGWVAGFFAIALWLDSIGEIAGWMAGTPISMARAGRDGFLPKRLSVREGDVAAGMLYAQAVAGTSISIVFTVVPDIEGVFWLLSALLVQLYVLMYILLFAAAWRLRQTRPDQRRAYRVPGGKVGMTLVCGVGTLACATVFVFGFFRPVGLTGIGESHYRAVLGTGLALSLICPILLIARYRMRNVTTKQNGAEVE